VSAGGTGPGGGAGTGPGGDAGTGPGGGTGAGAGGGELAFALRGVGTAVGGRFALRDVSFELPTGYVMGLIGANGAGKTTAIRCLLGLRRFESGEAELLGHRVPGPVALRQDIGVVLDHTYLVGDWRLSEVERTLRPFYDRWESVRYRRLLDDFGLDLKARVKDLSRGMAMKLMIAVALSHRARLLVFDEPTSGLDPIGRMQVRAINQRLKNEGKTVFFSSHELGEVETVCDRVAIMAQGELKVQGRVDDLIRQYECNLEQIFLRIIGYDHANQSNLSVAAA